QGLGIGGGIPYYVVKVVPHENKVVVGRREEAVETEFKLTNINYQGAEPTDKIITGFVKVRSSGDAAGPVEFDKGTIRAQEGIFGVAPGQSAVLYSDKGAILLGGIIA
ncbi:tRNA 2-thiouridine(34) synthase MnmA, partial [bacterium]|nr:tRNA 2-thiouridine(34) synthase MnmA [bacterium]